MANKSARWAIFVHGCFWHAHETCALATVPKTNTAFWTAKLAANRERDAMKVEALRNLGYKVIVVWQCELSDAPVVHRVLRQIGRSRQRRCISAR